MPLSRGLLRLSSCISTPLILLALLLATGALQAQSGSGEPMFYLVLSLDGEQTRILSATLTQSPYHWESQPPAQFESERLAVLGLGENPRDGIAVTVQDANGQPVFTKVFPVLKELHGEFRGAERPTGGWSIERFEQPLPEPLAVVRIPVVDDSHIVLESLLGASQLESVDVLALIAESENKSLAKSASFAFKTTAPAAIDNRVDLLVMGDGYTLAQQGQFLNDASVFVEESMFGTTTGFTPYKEYSNYVRVTKLFVASAQTGADHPPYNPSCAPGNPACCADPQTLSDPLAGTYKNTALGARYCAFDNSLRTLVTDPAAVLTAAAAVPTWDSILVLVNDATYGGTASSPIGTFSLSPEAVDTARHEYGHAFAGLADEYDFGFAGSVPCTEPFCRANVTSETNPSLLKWSPWVPAGVPIPTPEGISDYSDVVGLFEGAQYLPTGMYRPKDFKCIMQFQGQPFCEICRQEYVLRLYRGGWGNPVSGIESIEPGSPLPSVTSFRKCAGPLTFSIQPLHPASGPAQVIRWIVNGDIIPGQNAASFLYSSTPPQGDGVAVTVTDPTSFVHPFMDPHDDLTSSHVWLVTTVNLPSTIALQNHNVTTSELHEACSTITAGPAVEVKSGGSLTLRAGTSVTLSAGFKVESGGQLKVGVGPVFPN